MKVKSKMSGTKNIPPIYSPKIPMGEPPTGKRSAAARPSTGSMSASIKGSKFGSQTRGGGSTINPTGINR